MALRKQRFILLFKCLVTLELLYFLVLLYFHFKADPGQSKLGKKDCGTNALFAVYCKEVIYRTAIYQEHYIEVLIETSVGLECWRYISKVSPDDPLELHVRFEQYLSFTKNLEIPL